MFAGGCCLFLFLHQRSWINAPEPARTPTGHFNSDPSADIFNRRSALRSPATRRVTHRSGLRQWMRVVPFTFFLLWTGSREATGGSRGNLVPGPSIIIKYGKRLPLVRLSWRFVPLRPSISIHSSVVKAVAHAQSFHSPAELAELNMSFPPWRTPLPHSLETLDISGLAGLA